MAFDTYTDLKAAVATWMKRTDLTAQIPDYITLAEKSFRKLAKLRPLEIEATLTGTPSSDVIALPSDFEQAIGLWDTSTNPRNPLGQRLPEALPVDSSPGTPEYWAVDGTNVRFERPLDGAYTFALRYAQKFALSVSNPTNYVLTEYPNVYLFGALAEGSNDTFDDGRAAMWFQRFKSAVEAMNTAEGQRNRNVTLRTEISASRRFDITKGE